MAVRAGCREIGALLERYKPSWSDRRLASTVPADRPDSGEETEIDGPREYVNRGPSRVTTLSLSMRSLSVGALT